MANAADESIVPCDIRERVKRIDKIQAELSKTMAELVEDRQDTRIAPITLAFTGVAWGRRCSPPGRHSSS